MSNAANNKKNKIIIILISIAFISPLLLSWFFFNHTDVVENIGTSNHGDLIIPPRPMDNLPLIDALKTGVKGSLYGKWSMVYVAESCDRLCMDNVYRMRQIHIAMDKHSPRVQRVLFLTGQYANELTGLLANYAGQQVIDNGLININTLLEKFRLTVSDNPLTEHRIYIIDPLGNLMMSFQPEANPGDIMKDLKLLLRASHIG